MILKKNNSAYTLIELLVGITITTIVFTVGYAGFREFSRRQVLTGVTKTAIADLRQIQQLALTGQKPNPALGVCTKLVGYSFNRLDQDTYQLIANCDNNGTMATRTVKSVDLNGVTFTAITPSTTFKILGQGTSLSSNNILTFTHVATGTTATITIGTGGQIQ